MGTEDELIREAEAAERLAALVSYHPDKKRLLKQAAELRARAASLRGDRPATSRDDDGESRG